MIEFYLSHMLARQVSDLTGPSRHVQPLRSNGWTCRAVRTAVPHTKSANTACKTLLNMDR